MCRLKVFAQKSIHHTALPSMDSLLLSQATPQNAGAITIPVKNFPAQKGIGPDFFAK